MPAHPCLIPSCTTRLHGWLPMCGAHFTALPDRLRQALHDIANEKPGAPRGDERAAVLREAVEIVCEARDFAAMTAAQLNDWYEQTVGYRPQVDDPTMGDADLRSLCKEYLAASRDAERGP